MRPLKESYNHGLLASSSQKFNQTLIATWSLTEVWKGCESILLINRLALDVQVVI